MVILGQHLSFCVYYEFIYVLFMPLLKHTGIYVVYFYQIWFHFILFLFYLFFIIFFLIFFIFFLFVC